MTRPLLFGGTGNENLTFAPYHTHYPMLEAHMLMSGLTPKINEWNNPLLLGKLMFPAGVVFGKFCQGKAKKVSANPWLPLFHSVHTSFFLVFLQAMTMRVTCLRRWIPVHFSPSQFPSI